MPEITPNSPVQTQATEEQIVQSIVEILNTKGYEYERDVRPIICWKYKVESSRELSLEQKLEVKTSLEDGTFEQWGLEFRKQVIDQDVDIVKQIEQLKDQPSPVSKNISRKNQAEQKNVSEDKPSGKISIDLNKKEPDTPEVKSKPRQAKRKTKGSIQTSNKKIAVPDEKIISIDKNKSAKTLLDSSTSIKLEALNKKNETKDKKVPLKRNTPSQTVDPTSATQPKQESAEQMESSVNTTAIPDTPQTVADKADADEKVLIARRKKDQLISKADQDPSVKMDFEEAKQIVKDTFAEDLVAENTLVYSIILTLTLAFFGISIYANILLLMSRDLPSWLKFICNFFS